MQPAASAQAASHSAGEIQARVGGCGEEEEEEDEAMQLLTIVTGDLISGYVAHLTQQTEQQQQPLLQQGLQQQLQQQLQQLQEQLPAVQQHLLLSQQQQQQWMEKLWQQQFQHMQQVQEQLQQVQRQQELVQQLQQQEQLLDVQQQQQLLQELQKKYQLQEVQLMRRFKQLHQMQQEHFQQLQQFKEWQELQRQARQIQRQLREVRSLLQTSRRLVRMRVELLQEALDTRGDALLAEFEASIPDFVRRAEELAKQVDPRRLVVTLAWQVLTAGPMSWGCVLSMVVFCALLVKNLRASGRLGDSEETWPLTDAVAAVLLTTCKTWLMEQGGWEAHHIGEARLDADSTLPEGRLEEALDGFGWRPPPDTSGSELAPSPPAPRRRPGKRKRCRTSSTPSRSRCPLGDDDRAAFLGCRRWSEEALSPSSPWPPRRSADLCREPAQLPWPSLQMRASRCWYRGPPSSPGRQPRAPAVGSAAALHRPAPRCGRRSVETEVRARRRNSCSPLVDCCCCCCRFGDFPRRSPAPGWTWGPDALHRRSASSPPSWPSSSSSSWWRREVS
ncbi:uncharacterized protein LOC133362363 isoform X2 [Lethenteron reissneri]|uniref:uncharacterized protein LOC133362363 isoform X2 n=1 Tax=Lethenteron reissneri TaxID=7753 RepID=UPI002AB653FA|nr:uncharacterized protein LOC133362363 isoform X2 [Lethenteron reissneri]